MDILNRKTTMVAKADETDKQVLQWKTAFWNLTPPLLLALSPIYLATPTLLDYCFFVFLYVYNKYPFTQTNRPDM
jgi:hypothetical protein